jgi:hypothetical protein
MKDPLYTSWQTWRAEVMKRAKYRCVGCNGPKPDTELRLYVHALYGWKDLESQGYPLSMVGQGYVACHRCKPPNGSPKPALRDFLQSKTQTQTA